ncbi:MAG: hypothetical protein Tsb0015_16000 [Simkaniaceae bacterium]
MDPFATVPKEIGLHILSFLDEKELRTVQTVSSKWNLLAKEALYKKIWKKTFPDQRIPLDTTLLEYVGSHMIKTKDKLIQIMQDFFTRSFSKQDEELIVNFPFDAQCSILLSAVSDKESYSEPSREFYIFYSKLLAAENKFSFINKENEIVNKIVKIFAVVPQSEAELYKKIQNVSLYPSSFRGPFSPYMHVTNKFTAPTQK